MAGGDVSNLSAEDLIKRKDDIENKIQGLFQVLESVSNHSIIDQCQTKVKRALHT